MKNTYLNGTTVGAARYSKVTLSFKYKSTMEDFKLFIVKNNLEPQHVFENDNKYHAFFSYIDFCVLKDWVENNG